MESSQKKKKKKRKESKRVQRIKNKEYKEQLSEKNWNWKEVKIKIEQAIILRLKHAKEIWKTKMDI